MRSRAVKHVASSECWRQCHNFFGLVGLVLRGDEDLCAAVVDDVREFIGRQTARATGVDDSRVVAAPHHFKKSRVVLEADGHVVARLETEPGKYVAETVGTCVELTKGERLAATRHDDGGAVRGSLGDFSGEHDVTKVAQRLPSLSCRPKP